MVALIVLIVLVPIVILGLLVSILNKTSTQQDLLRTISERLRDLNTQVQELAKELKGQKQPPASEQLYKEIIEKPVQVFSPPFKKEPVEKIETKEPLAEVPAKPVMSESKTESVIPKQREEQEPGWWDTWLQNNPDLEKFIGENLANKIGIAVLVLGISFFVKYAIDNDWINETGRVIIGLLSGGILIGLAHYIRNSYRSFSSVLVGGGLSVFYFTIAYAFHQYHLVSQSAAFIIMIVITGFAVILSLLYDRLELAILATLGGFIAPFLVSTGQDNYIALFTYLCILNTGLMVLAYFKRWPAINFIAIFFTVIIYGGWFIQKFLNDESSFPYKNALFFATLFYVLFMAMNLVNNVRKNRRFDALDFIVVLSVNFLYYVAGMLILSFWSKGDYKGLFTALLGVINLILAWLFFKDRKTDKNLVYLFIGLTLTFISLAAPVQLKGNYITLFWAAECVVLFWLYQRSNIQILKIASLGIVALMFISLLMDWEQIYYSSNSIIPVIINKGFTTSVVVASALLIYYQLMKKEANSYYLPGLTNYLVRNILLIGSIVIVYIIGMLEIYYQFNTRGPGTNIYAIYLQLYSFAMGFILLRIFHRSPNQAILKFSIPMACFVFYLFNIRINYEISMLLLSSGLHTMHFISHWVSAVLLFKLLFDVIVYFRKNSAAWASYQVLFTWITIIEIILLLSVEMYHVILWINYAAEDDRLYWENLYYKAGLSILWGFCSFIMMWLGMKYHFSTLRIISLSLFSITLVKLFAFDIRNIPPGGKIAAFILLGVLLLTISFMYQRLKKIIIDDAIEEI
jgi:uncharacterized membrane protein